MKEADAEDRAFQELGRKIREAKVLSPCVKSVLAGVRFTGRLSVVVQNGRRVLKSGYEEGYFTRRQEDQLIG